MSALPLALAAGGLVGAGVAVTIRALVPQPPDLAAAMARLDGRAPLRVLRETPQGEAGILRRPAEWLQRTVGGTAFAPLPTRELVLLRMTPEEFFERKVIATLGGFLLPVLISAAATPILLMLGSSVPLPIPLLVSVLLAAVMWFIPDLEVRGRAEEARSQVRRALCAYHDLIALERVAGSGSIQALNRAAAVGDSWVFLRLREELLRADLNSVSPWDGLRELGKHIGVSELEGLGDVMQMTEKEGSAAYSQLRARARSQRNALLAQMQTGANKLTVKMSVPSTMLSLVFSALLLFPGMSTLL